MWLFDFCFLFESDINRTNLYDICDVTYYYKTSTERSHWGGKGGRVPPLKAKNLPKFGKKRERIRKNQEKIRKNQEKRGKIGKKGKNREVSFTLPLLTDRVGYATVQNMYLVMKVYK